MAKSKSGGTRSYLRGRIANDVYSIGKDAQGKKQQVVRSLAETVKNPQTLAQMKGRAVMSTVMQAVSALSFAIDHSFDGVPAGQPSLSEFIKRNYRLVADDAQANPATPQAFNISDYQQKGIQFGKYVVADGKIALPAFIKSFDGSNPQIATSILVASATAASVRQALSFGGEDYLTLISLFSDRSVRAVRLKVSSALADDTPITTANFESLFNIESVNGGVLFIGSSGSGDREAFTFSCVDEGMISPIAFGVIFTKKTVSGFEHTPSTIHCLDAVFESFAHGMNEAIVTYPLGTERFLNGGDLNGQSVSVSSTASTSSSSSGSADEGDDLPGQGNG